MKKFLISTFVVVLLLIIAYAAGIGYYAEKFQANTLFGNVDISNLTLNEAQAKVEDEINKQEITITENGNQVATLQLGDLNPEMNIEQTLTQVYNSQNPNNWLMNYFSGSQINDENFNLVENMTIDTAQLHQQLVDSGLDNSQRQASEDAYIDYNESQGYFVQEEKLGNQIDFQQLEDLIAQGLQTRQDSVEINQAYQAPEVTNDDEAITEFMNEIDQATQLEITLNIANNVEVIGKDLIEKWLYFDDNNQIVFDEVAIYEYLGTLNDKYATYNKPRQFESTLEGVVTVEPGTLGWSINRESETQNIINDLMAGQDVEREPAIDGSGYETSKRGDGDDIGDSYIEVSVDHQHMWVYKDGQVVVDTPIVTGQIGTDTVVGAYSIWSKDRDAALQGYNPRTASDYVQPVDYWLPFDETGQGIHDANWQADFGGTVYQTAGSLGCINTPPSAMAQVFEAAELGMPVIVH